MNQFETFFSLTKKIWFMMFYLVSMVLVYIFLDETIAIFFHGLDTRHRLIVLTWLTGLGKWQLYVVFFGLLGCYARWYENNPVFESRSWFLLACVLIPNLLGLIIKISLGRARPDLLFSQNLFGFYWFKLNENYWSFPSGHTLTVIGLACGLSVILRNYFYWLLFFAILVVATRVILYHHYLSDVMAGFYLAIIASGAVWSMAKRTPFFNKNLEL